MAYCLTSLNLCSDSPPAHVQRWPRQTLVQRSHRLVTSFNLVVSDIAIFVLKRDVKLQLTLSTWATPALADIFDVTNRPKDAANGHSL